MILKLRNPNPNHPISLHRISQKEKGDKNFSKKEPHHQRNRQRTPRQLETQALFARGRVAGEGHGGVCAVDACAAVGEGVRGREGGDRVLGFEKKDC